VQAEPLEIATTSFNASIIATEPRPGIATFSVLTTDFAGLPVGAQAIFTNALNGNYSRQQKNS
jgi:hypothetical protein